MKVNQWINAIFSPTGGTAKVARSIAKGSGLEVREVDLSAPVTPEELPEGAVLAAAVPVFGGRVPAAALERLAALKGKGNPAVAVAVYGNRAYEDALLELKNALEQGGFQVVAAGAFIAEHSIVRSIAAGRPDGEDTRAAEAFGASVAAKLAAGDSFAPLQVPGSPEYKEYKGLPFHPKADRSCTKCGTCAASCPVGAIPVEDPSGTDEARCISCMRCVAVCPEGARALPAAALLGSKTMLMACASKPRKPEQFL